MKKRLEKENRNKYGCKSNDIIAVNYREYGAGFIVGNLQKLSRRIVNVSKMNLYKRLTYRYLLRKGGEADVVKIHDFLSRLEELNHDEYYHWVVRINNELDGIA